MAAFPFWGRPQGFQILDVHVNPDGHVVITCESVGNSTNVLWRGATLDNISQLTTWAPGAASTVTLEDANPLTDMAYYRIQRVSSGEPFDTDSDGLDDAVELGLGTDLAKPDTDGDGWTDGVEVADGTDPLDPASAPRVTVVSQPPTTVDFQNVGALGTNGAPITMSTPPVSVVFRNVAELGTVGTAVTVAAPPLIVVFPSPDALGTAGTAVTVADPPVSLIFPDKNEAGAPQDGVTLAKPPVTVGYSDMTPLTTKNRF